MSDDSGKRGRSVDWLRWHERYGSEPSLTRRLDVVRAELTRLLDDRAERASTRIVSLCAGQGRDVLPVLAAHRRRRGVRARLVELDPHNAAIAEESARGAGLTGVEVVRGDASLLASYDGAVPADIVLVCGVFGNISDNDIARTIDHLPMLCAPGAAVIWTRGARPPDLRPAVRRWFAERGFEELAFHGDPESYGVGVQRLLREPEPLDPRVKLFTFLR